ncbi:MAG: adenylate/guanylate cyclase domain-containing protein [Acidimicrobiales bacterium]
MRFAKSGDVHVAYQVLGEGPTDIVYVQGGFSHLGVMWELPAFQHFCELLSSFSRLIWFDKRGMGLSDRVQAGTLDERMDDVRAVMDAVDSRRAVVLGESEGGPLSMLFAAAHPERTAALLLVGAEVKERATEDWPWGESTPEQFEDAMEGLAERWGNGRFIDYIAPSLADNPGVREWAQRMQINAPTPGAAESFMRMAFDIDVRPVVPTIGVPTLIVHRTGDSVCNVENARYLARTVPGAVYVELSGNDHAPWASAGETVAEIREFLTGVREPLEPERVLATVLFTDIVGSTERAAALGDERWKELLDLHDRAVRDELRRFRGREVNTTGDGFVASFDGPARALRAAQAIRVATSRVGIELRLGVHTGECEVRGDDLAGLAVHIAARVGALSGPGEVLVSRTVKDLVAGSGIEFRDRGEHQLKGVPGTWNLFAMEQ